MIHASEAGHYYWPDGRPAYQVPGSKPDTLVTPDIRHARKLGLYVGTTTIIRQAAAPGLERWKQQQVLHAALTLPRLPGEPESDFLARIMADSQEQAKNAATLGTAIHKAIQTYFEDKREGHDWLDNIPPSVVEYWHHVNGTVRELDGVYGRQDWIAEKSFAHQLGFGGKCDLHTSSIVIDLKTKEFGPDTKLETYDEHAQQLAAYRMGLQMPKARCAIVYVSVTVPGLAKVIELDQEELQRGWEMFKVLLSFWKAKTGYDPAIKE